ncbi:hypothetical protein [Bacillus cereus group sp. Bce015]|uniref:hypothetical protein n=1 Tax=Bacillus cereus group sp. Bce015 TaxID=3445249 RepID=UPI003F21EAB2
MSKVDLNAVKDIDLTQEKQGEGKLFSADVLIEDAPERKKRKPGPKKRKHTRKKTFNLSIPLTEYIENYCLENDISETDFVNNTLEKVFKIKKETPKKESK